MYRILYVDDEPGLLDIGKLFLEQSGEFKITTVLNAPDAIRLLEQERFDAIISDYQMPGMDGIQFLVEVRKHFGQIPFILFTGRGREEVVIQAINNGVDSYLQKGGDPTSQFAELAHSVNSAISRKKADAALRESEETFKTLFERGGAAIFTTDHTSFLDCNRKTEEIFRCSRDQIIGHTPAEFSPEHQPDGQLSAEIIKVKMDAAFLGEEQSFDWVHIRHDGTLFNAHVILNRVMVRGTYYLQVIVQDITERKRAEEELIKKNEELAASGEELKSQFDALSESEHTTRFLVEQLVMSQDIGHNGSWLYNVGTDTTWGSAEAHRLFGFPPVAGDFPMADKESCIPERERIHQALVDLIHTGKEYNLEYLIHPADGSAPKVIHSIARLEKDAQGNPSRVVGVFQDITGRRQAEEALVRKHQDLESSHEKLAASYEALRRNYEELTRKEQALKESEERYRGLADTIISGVAIYEVRNDGASGNDYIIKDFNTTALEIEGKTKEEVIGRSLLDLRPTIDDYGLIPVFKRVWETGVPEFFPQTIYMDNKYSRWYENRVFRMQNGDIVAVYDDVTERIRAELALKDALEEAQRFRDALDHVSSYIYLKDRQSRYIYANRQTLELFGCSLEELAGSDDTRFFPPDTVKQIREMDKRVFAGEKTEEELEVADAKGGRHVYWDVKAPIYTDAGRTTIWGLCGVSTDITDRKRAEEALGESERRMKCIISFLPDATFVIDKNGTILAWNRAMVEMTNVPAEQMIGKGNYEYALPFYHERRPIMIDLILHDDPAVAATYPFIKREGRCLFSEIFIPHLNKGRGAYLWFIACSLYDITGNLTGAIESIRDITELKRVEDALREEQLFSTSLLDSLPGIFYLYTYPEHQLIRWNKQHETLLGYTAEEMKGKLVSDWHLPEFKDAVLKAINEVMEQGQSSVESNLIAKDGHTIPFFLTGVRFEARGRLYYMGIGIDITERRMMETALRISNKKLNLLSSITRHDINNQLTVLIGYINILNEKLPDRTLNEYIEKISTSAKRISSMIQFTKEYEAIGIRDPAWQDCRTTIDIAAKEVLPGQITVKNELPAGTEVFADPLIVKVFYNLIDNAIRYGKKITTIRFSVEEYNGDHVIVCEDDGDGVVAEEKEKIFERGFGKNTGMGLALAREILDITGISIRETGEPGKGARFEIIVPEGAYRFTGTGTREN